VRLFLPAKEQNRGEWRLTLSEIVSKFPDIEKKGLLPGGWQHLEPSQR
jgi:hypothetical protein